MFRRTRNRRESGEINLTPLLDVLFSILFIVMLTGAQSERLIQKDMEVSAAQIGELEEQISELTEAGEIARLQEEIAALEAELERLRHLQESEALYEADAVIVTIDNGIEDGNHVLRFYLGQEGRLTDTVRMGTDKTIYIHDRVTDIVGKIASDAPGKPVYVVFHCNPALIYRREEYVPVQQALSELKGAYKEIFYQIVEEETDG